MNELHDKWIVVTTILQPTSDIKYLSNIPGWKIVVVGDERTPKDWNHTNCIFISLESQSYLPFSIIKLLPTGSYSRKAIGYLYAIANGAEVIYETDDDNRPYDNLQNFNLNSVTFGMRYDGQGLFNPYSHFGQSSLWPRGFPLENIGIGQDSIYSVGKYTTPYIQQGLVNGDPNVDAIFRLTRKSRTSKINVTFDSVAPPVIVPSGVLSPFNSQNTLFLYDALWAMVLPVSTTFRVSDIWRSYWAQRLLWEIGGNIAFYPPNALQKRNPHSYINDAKDETVLYFKTNELTQFLFNWRCDRSLKFFKCVEKLSRDMANANFWSKMDVDLIDAWLKDLKDVGYIEPARLPYVFPESQRPQKLLSRTVFQPSEQRISPAHKNPTGILDSKLKQIRGITTFCNATIYQITQSSLTPITYPNILLVIVFNFPIYDNIPYLEFMYGVTFSHIVYCGNSQEAFINSSRKFQFSVTFLEEDVNRGFYAEKCLVGAMKMNYDVQGYLLIGDDTLLNSWNIPNLPLDKMWFQNTEAVFRDKAHGWHWWNGGIGRSAFNRAWDELLNISKKDGDKKNTISAFMSRLAHATGSKLGGLHGPSDIVFIPKRFKYDVIFFMDIFIKHNVFMEIVFPSVIFGLDDKKNIIKLPGQYLWYDGKRNHVPELFNPIDIFLHPVKLSSVKSTLKTFFCHRFFPYILTGPIMVANNRTV